MDYSGCGRPSPPTVPSLGTKRQVEGGARGSASDQYEKDHTVDQRVALIRLSCSGDEKAGTQPDYEGLHPGWPLGEIRRQECSEHPILLLGGPAAGPVVRLARSVRGLVE